MCPTTALLLKVRTLLQILFAVLISVIGLEVQPEVIFQLHSKMPKVPVNDEDGTYQSDPLFEEFLRKENGQLPAKESTSPTAPRCAIAEYLNGNKSAPTKGSVKSRNKKSKSEKKKESGVKKVVKVHKSAWIVFFFVFFFLFPFILFHFISFDFI